MKKLISKWPGRLMSLFVPFALVASFFAPTSAAVIKEMSLGGGGTDGSEGDPLDTNDVGGGGGGGGDVHNDTAPPPTVDPLGFSTDRYQILLVPEMVGGILIFRIIVVEKSELGLIDFSMEATHAP